MFNMDEEESELYQSRPDFNALQRNPYSEPGNLAQHAQDLLNQMASGDQIEVLQAVMQLSMHLAVAPQDAFSALPLNQTMTTLVDCLSNPLPDVSLYAIISINHIIDSVPNSPGALASSGGVSALCMKLMNFDYIDMAEHTITTLQRLAYDHSTAILKQEAFSMMINMMDFFENNTQKKILMTTTIVAKSVQSIDLMIDYIVPTLPVLSSLLQFRGEDFLSMNKMGIQFYQALAESVIRLCSGDSISTRQQLELIAQNGLFQNLVELLPNAKEMKGSIFKILNTLCVGSPQLTLLFHNLGASSVIREALENFQETSFAMEALQLVDAMIPPKVLEDEIDQEFASLYNENPELMRSMGEILLPQILDLYQRIVNKNIRNLVLQIMDQILAYSQTDLVITYATPSSFSTFLSELLTCKDAQSIKSALSIVLVLLNKVPQQMEKNFVRQGVIDKITNLTDEQTVKKLNFPNISIQELIKQNPHNLRQLLAHTGIPRDSPLLQHILRQINRKRMPRRGSGAFEQIEDMEDPQLVRAQSQPSDIPDILTQNAQQIVGLASAALQKREQYQNPESLNTLQELKQLSNLFSTDSSECDSSLPRRLIQVMTGEEGVSLHEVTHSNILDAVWKWFTSQQSRIARKRIYEFLHAFYQNSPGGETYMEVFIRLVVKTVRYTQQFIILIYQSQNMGQNSFLGMKTIANRVKFQLVYDEEEMNRALSSGVARSELQMKQALFTEVPKLTLCFEQYLTFDTIIQGLLKAKTPENLQLMASSFQRTNAQIRGVNQGQLNLVRQNMKMQHMLSQSMNLQRTLDQMGIRLQGNQELLKEIEAQRQSEVIQKLMEEQGKEEQDQQDQEVFEQPIQAMAIADRKQSILECPSIQVVLSLNGHRLEKHTTLFQAISKYGQGSEDSITIKFHFEPFEQSPKQPSTYLNGQNFFINLINQANNTPVESSQKVFKPLRLLKFFYLLNQNLPEILSNNSIIFEFPIRGVTSVQVPNWEFVCPKLQALLQKQSSDILAMVGGMTPQWIRTLPKHSPYLFNFNLRYELFRGTAFRNGRSLFFYSLKGKSFQVRMLRQKAMIPRDNVFQAGMRILGDTALLKFGMLQFDFTDEEGTGIGPTHEFYTLISKQIRKLDIWRNTGQQCGLFPSPTQIHNPVYLDECFFFIGKLTAKALYDDKLIDLPFSPAFWKLVLRKPLSLVDILQIDPQLGRHLLELQQVVNRKNQAQHQLGPQRRKNLTFKGAEISDLMLTFTLPGYEIDLKLNGKNQVVNINNLQEYINLVAESTLLQNYQADAFRRGFEKLIDSNFLEFFNLDELESVICGKQAQNWEFSMLQDTIIPAHGYTKNSEVFKNLLLLMSKLDFSQQRQFLQFVTGSPRLPLGGFKALHPSLTVVRKMPTDSAGLPDQYLPSVMTCQNYLKIPEYSNYETLEKYIKYVITEACESFHLSQLTSFYNMDSFEQELPTFYEMVLQDKLQNLIFSSLSFVIRHTVDHFPRLTICRYYVTQLASIVQGTLDVYFLKSNSANISENFYSLCRNSSFQVPVLVKYLILNYGVPLFIRKIPEQYGKNIKRIYHWIKGLHMLGYLYFKFPYYSPVYSVLKQQVIRSPWPSEISYFLLFALLSLKALEIYVNTRSERRDSSQVRVLPPPYNSTEVPKGKCGICRNSYANPTALTVSGYVFCYLCVKQYVEVFGTCPITGVPAAKLHIRRVHINQFL